MLIGTGLAAPAATVCPSVELQLEVVALLPRQPALQQVRSWLGVVRETNTPSVRVLLRAGFRHGGPSPKPGFMTYIKP